MIRVRRRKLLSYGLPILLALFAADQGYGLLAARSLARDRSGLQVGVRAEQGALGHNTIGIAEDSLGAGTDVSALRHARGTGTTR